MLLWEAGHPGHAGFPTPGGGSPGRDCANIHAQTEALAHTQAPRADKRSHHTDTRMHARTQVHTYLSGTHPPTPLMGQGGRNLTWAEKHPQGHSFFRPPPLSPQRTPRTPNRTSYRVRTQARDWTRALDGLVEEPSVSETP